LRFQYYFQNYQNNGLIWVAYKMKKALFVIPLFFGFFVGYYAMHFYGSGLFMKGEVLSEEVSSAPAPSPTATPTLTPSPSPTLTNTPAPSATFTPTPTSVLQPSYNSEQINAFIERFAAQYSVDSNVLRHIAVCESGFNPTAVKLSYAGLYQFSPSTWATYRNLMGEDAEPDLRFNAEEAVQTAAYVISIGKTHIWPSCTP
jgi:hypothetical protein